MTPAQHKSNHRQLMKEIGNELRAKDRITLNQIRARIHEAQAKRRVDVANARHSCRAARTALRERQEAERERLKYDQAAARIARRGACQQSQDQARSEGRAAVDQWKGNLHSTRKEQKVIERAGKAPRLRSTSRERSQESDDQVRSNIPHELVPVFNKVRAKMKASSRRSRTEAFLEWAHENPDEIVQVQQADADRDLKRLIAQEKEQNRVMRKATRYTKLSKEEVTKRLADVPF